MAVFITKSIQFPFFSQNNLCFSYSMLMIFGPGNKKIFILSFSEILLTVYYAYVLIIQREEVKVIFVHWNLQITLYPWIDVFTECFWLLIFIYLCQIVLPELVRAYDSFPGVTDSGLQNYNTAMWWLSHSAGSENATWQIGYISELHFASTCIRSVFPW